MVTKEELENAVKKSYTIIDTVFNLGLPIDRTYTQLVSKYIRRYDIDIRHFKHNVVAKKNKPFVKKELSEILIENSDFSRGSLKERLYKEGIKQRVCELCGQTEEWQGKHMSLIIDHINGKNDDHRLENLRIVCPNCDATLNTFAGKNKLEKTKVYKHKCVVCGAIIDKRSILCKQCDVKKRYKENIKNRPTLEILLKEVAELGYSATGRKYNVSDTAIRKWIKLYKKNES